MHFYFALLILSACVPSNQFDLEALNLFKSSGRDKKADKTKFSVGYEFNDLISIAPAIVTPDAGFLQSMRSTIGIVLRALTAKNESAGGVRQLKFK